MTKEVQFLYNMVVMKKNELEDEFSYLLDERRIWEKNQFTFWNAQGRETFFAEHLYIDPIRRIMLAKTAKEVPPRLSIDQNNNMRYCESCAEYLAWLHHPILMAMHDERMRITSRALNGFNTLESRQKHGVNIIVGSEDIDNPMSWKPVLDPDQDYVKNATDKLIARLEASVWSINNVMRPEWIEQMQRFGVGVDDEDDERHREFPIPSGRCYHWSNMVTRGKQLEMRQQSVFIRIQREDTPPSTEPLTERGRRFQNRRAITDPPTNNAKFANHANLGDLFNDNTPNRWKWEPINDTISKMLNSQMMVGGQSQAFQTFIGTRVHFRLSIAMSGGLLEQPAEENGYIKLQDGRIFFPSLDAPEAQADQNTSAVFTRGKRGEDSDERMIASDVYTFLKGEEERALDMMSYTKIIMWEMQEGFKNFLEAYRRSLPEEDTFRPSKFIMVGLEVPLWNPFFFV